MRRPEPVCAAVSLQEQEAKEVAVPYPKMLRVRQKFERPRVEDVPVTVRQELEKLDLGKRIKPGHSVALTAGSRGIANIPLILQSVARFLKDLGANPFLV